MIPIDFDGSNALLSAPDGCKSNIEPACVLITAVGESGKSVITRWKLTAEELAEFDRTKCIWIEVVSPRDQPPNPIAVSAIRPFELRPPSEGGA